VSRPLGPDSDFVCSDLERNVSITTQLLREKPGGGPSATRTSDRSCTVRHATQPHRLRFRIQSRPKKGKPRGVIDFVGSNPGSTAGDVARARGLNRTSVAKLLAQLAKSGELTKAKRGYAAPNCA
jgi:hypothetical protein